VSVKSEAVGEEDMQLIDSTEIANGPAPFFIKPILRQIGSRVRGAFLDRNFSATFKFIEEQLATVPDGGEFFCGKEMTGADIMMLFPLQAAKGRAGVSQSSHPKICAWVDRMQALDSYKRADKKIEEATGEKIDSTL
jgi:glutathione S-transferase